MSCTRIHSSTGNSHSIALAPATPAELTSTSILPKAVAVSLAAAATWLIVDDVDRGGMHLGLSRPAPWRVLARAPASRSHRLTVAPESTMRCAIASPMPDTPPVTMAHAPGEV